MELRRDDVVAGHDRAELDAVLGHAEAGLGVGRVGVVRVDEVAVPAGWEARDDRMGAAALDAVPADLGDPPAVGEVLQRDPSLLTRADYLAPYPVLWAFLQKHPEIVRNPSFFLGRFEYY